MKEGKTIPLDEICNVEYGTRVVQKRDGGSIYPVYGGGGATFQMDEFNREDRLVIARFGMSAGCTRFIAGKFFLNDSGLTVSPKNGALLPRFLDYQMLSLNDDIYALGKGTAQKNLDVPVFRTLPLFVPSDTKEQQRIVGILDETFDGIATAKANAKKNLKNARALFESHLQSVFTQRGEGWVKKTLEELGTITSSKRIFKSEYVKSGVPFYRTKEVKELANGREISTELFISAERYEEIKVNFGVPKRGDILLTAIGTIGEIYVVQGEDNFYFKDGNVLWLKDFTTINSDFLKYVLISFVESLNKMAHGSAYSALPIQRLNAHKILVPSLVEQGAIVSQLDSLQEETQRLESLYQRKLAALDALKQSLLHQAFSGLL